VTVQRAGEDVVHDVTFAYHAFHGNDKRIVTE